MRLYILSECEGGDIPSLLLKDVFFFQNKKNIEIDIIY